jgi:hypothetical protein
MPLDLAGGAKQVLRAPRSIARKLGWQRRLRATRWQVGMSVLLSAAVILSHLIGRSRHADLVLGSFGIYFGFLAGLAAILILVASVTAALLVYYFQAVKSDSNYYYARYRECVADLRLFLDRLCETGMISRSYDDPYRNLETLTNPKELPLAFRDPAAVFVEVIGNELHEQLGAGAEFEWAFGSVVTRLAIAEETANGLGLNLIRLISLELWVKPVLKSFWTLAAVVLAALIAVIHFSGIIIVFLNGLAIGVSCMTVLLLFEAGLLAVQESIEFFDIRSDAASEEETEPDEADAAVGVAPAGASQTSDAVRQQHRDSDQPSC